MPAATAHQNAECDVTTIDFAPIARPLISGRETGRSFRHTLEAAGQLLEAARYVIVVPDSVRVITPSVFMGLIGKELRKCQDIEDVESHFLLEGARTVTRDNFYDAARACLASR